MPVIARDAVASDHLVYAWPFPIGPEEYEVACAEDEQVVMCPAWIVGDRLGPGRHRWRTPDPMRPASAYFVLTAPVEVSFDLATSFIIPTTGQPVRLRAAGSLQVRCSDPGLLVAQFVGLPFDSVNDGILRSVSRSVERMLARLLTRRVLMAGTPAAVTDPGMLPNIIEELIAYNPTAGAVFGVELIRMGHLAIGADDGSQPLHAMQQAATWTPVPTNGEPPVRPSPPPTQASGEIVPRHTSVPPTEPSAAGSDPNLPALQGATPPLTTPPPGSLVGQRPPSTPPTEASGEIVPRPHRTSEPPRRPGTPTQRGIPTAPAPFTRQATPVEMPHSSDEITQPGVPSPAPGMLRSTMSSSPPPPAAIRTPVPGAPPPPPTVRPTTPPPVASTPAAAPPAPAPAATPPAATPPASPPAAADGATPPRAGSEPSAAPRGAILGIGVGHIGGGATDGASGGSSGVASGEIPSKMPPGARVLVPGPNGLMQSATVRQLLQGYYELEVGGSGETIWVPINGVVPE